MVRYLLLYLFPSRWAELSWFLHWFEWNLHDICGVARRFKLRFQAAQRAILRAVPCISVIEDPEETLKGALVYCLINSHLIKAVASVWKCVWSKNRMHTLQPLKRMLHQNCWNICNALGFVFVPTSMELDKHCRFTESLLSGKRVIN